MCGGAAGHKNDWNDITKVSLRAYCQIIGVGYVFGLRPIFIGVEAIILDFGPAHDGECIEVISQISP